MKKPKVGDRVAVTYEIPEKRTFFGVVKQLLSAQFIFHDESDMNNHPMPRFCFYKEKNWRVIK